MPMTNLIALVVCHDAETPLLLGQALLTAANSGFIIDKQNCDRNRRIDLKFNNIA